MNQPKVLLICASPRRKGSSTMLLKRIQEATGGDLVFLPQSGSLEDLVQAMQGAGTIVISGPCYINTYPARLLELLERAALKGGFSGQKLYGVINGGMPYVHTHRHGLSVLHLFADQNQLSWQGGFVLGGGAMLDGQPLEKHVNHKKLLPAFESFTQSIVEGKFSPDSLYEEIQAPPGKLLTYIFARILTFLVIKQAKDHGYDPDAPNWYLRNKD